MAEFIRQEKPKSEFEERVVSVDRISYTVAGGRRMRFRAVVVVGNRAGKVGMGIAKGSEVAVAVQKAVASAKKRLIKVAITNETIPHAVQTRYGSATVLLRPARPGTSVIAGSSVRAVIELAGIKNILSKALGSNNKINNVAATLAALRQVSRFQSTHEASSPKPAAGRDAVGAGVVEDQSEEKTAKTSATDEAEKPTAKKPRAMKPAHQPVVKKTVKKTAKKPAKAADEAKK